MAEKIENHLTEQLCEAMASLKSKTLIANFLEDVSAERGYAQHIIDNIHTVYGIALKEKKPLEDEIKDIEDRADRIRKSLESGKFSDEENARMDFAIKAHQRKVEQLKTLL